QQPAALQLRLLQTVVAVAAEKNSTLVLPFPVELLRFLERAQSGLGQGQGQELGQGQEPGLGQRQGEGQEQQPTAPARHDPDDRT
ncbi:slipin family protein, partial [Streptomyces triticiradicis]